MKESTRRDLDNPFKKIFCFLLVFRLYNVIFFKGVQYGDLTYVYIANDYHNQVSRQHIHHIIQLSFVCVCVCVCVCCGENI